MEFRALHLRGVVHIIPTRIGDERGYFSETFREDKFHEHVGPYHFVQDNQSLSALPGTIRGLHFQTNPNAQGKLVRCASGSLFDVAVDLRHDSPSYGQWVALTLSSATGDQLWIPPGFAHGFCALEPDTVISYKVTSYYSRDDDRGLAWDDPEIAIAWPDIAAPDTLSGKDRTQPRLRDLSPCFTMKD